MYQIENTLSQLQTITTNIESVKSTITVALITAVANISKNFRIYLLKWARQELHRDLFLVKEVALLLAFTRPKTSNNRP